MHLEMIRSQTPCLGVGNGDETVYKVSTLRPGESQRSLVKRPMNTLSPPTTTLTFPTLTRPYPGHRDCLRKSDGGTKVETDSELRTRGSMDTESGLHQSQDSPLSERR